MGGPGATWLVGVGINLVGSVLINLGTNVMKLGHNKREALPQPTTGCKPAVRTFREWQIGVTLFSVGNVANFISFGYAAQSLLAAIGCIQFVSNVIFASFVLKEQVSKGVMAATGCIVGGCMLLVSFGSHSSQKYTYKGLLRLYGQPAYVAYMAVGAAVVLAAYGAFWVGQKAIVSRGPSSARFWAAILPIMYSLFSAIVGTQSVLFSKTLAVLLRATASGDNQLTKWFTWIVLPAFLFTAVFWVSRLNKGLKMFPAMVIVPTLQICWTLFSILSGMLYFQEYEDMSALQASMFVLGVAVVFAGVYLLTIATASAARSKAALAEEAEGPLLLELAKAKVAYAQGCVGSGDADDDDDACDGELLGAVRESETATGEQLDSHPADGCPRIAASLPSGISMSSSFTAELAAAAAPGGTAGPGRAVKGIPSRASLSAASAISATHPPHCDFSHEHEAAGPADAAAAEEAFERSLLAATSGSLQEHDWGDSGWGRFSHDGGPGGSGGYGADLQASLPSRLGERQQQQQQRQKRQLKETVSSVSCRVKADFSLDETAAAKLSLGLGDSAMPGISLFAMPMADLNGGSPKVSVLSRRYGALPTRSAGGAAEPALAAAQAQRISLSTGFDNFGSRSSMETSSHHASVGAPGNRGINPLANAIDVPTSVLASNRVNGFDGLMEVAARSIKHNIQDIQANIKGLTANIQTAVSERRLGGAAAAAAGTHSYARMQSQESNRGDMTPVEEEPATEAAGCSSGLVVISEQQLPTASLSSGAAAEL